MPAGIFYCIGSLKSKFSVENVLPKLLDWSEQGLDVCLATLYHAESTSPRPVGSQMAVAQNGEWFGYLSGGCAEQAIADEAVACINAQQKSNNSLWRRLTLLGY